MPWETVIGAAGFLPLSYFSVAYFSFPSKHGLLIHTIVQADWPEASNAQMMLHGQSATTTHEPATVYSGTQTHGAASCYSDSQ